MTLEYRERICRHDTRVPASSESRIDQQQGFVPPANRA